MPGPDEIPAGGEDAARGLLLSSVDEGVIAKLDLVEFDGMVAHPIDYKRGAPPDVPERAYPPERAQVAAQALALRDNGWSCQSGALYFAETKQRVSVEITEELVETVRAAVRGLREAARLKRRPPPLEDSPKCRGCSLAELCLPDEGAWLKGGGASDPEGEADDTGVRRLFPPRDEGVPLHVSTQGAVVGKRGEELVVKKGGTPIGRARTPGVSAVSLYGSVQVTTAALRELLVRDIPVHFYSTGGWHYGGVGGHGLVGLAARKAQYECAGDDRRALALARRLVQTKIHNQRTLLMRNGDPRDNGALRQMNQAKKRALDAKSRVELMGCEGEAAAVYFAAFGTMIRPPRDVRGEQEDSQGAFSFEWTKRNRRPPTDPINAMLSFGYALLVGVCRTALQKCGLDPMLGVLHAERAGRPALALDIMEEFRPVLVDSVVVSAINNGEIQPKHFVARGPACSLNASGRKRFLLAWEARLETLVTHPVFGYRLSYRKLIDVQARLLSRHLQGEIDEYPEFKTR